VEGSASEAVNGAPADPALPTGKGDLGVAEAPEADATAGAESATTIDVPPPAEAATTPEATAAAAQAEDQPPADAPAEPAAESGTETTAKEQAEAGTEAAAEPAAKPKPGTPKATQGKTKAGAKPAKKAPAKKAAAEAGAATGAKTRAKAAAEDDAPPAAKPAAKAATRPRSRSAAKPDATADGKAPAAKSKSAKSTRKSSRKRRLQYKVGQQLVYPLQGVGQIRNIEERPFRNQTLLYYVVYLEVSDMTIMVPVDKADELGIRAIVPRAEARSALTLIGEDYEPIPTDWKLRYQMNLDLLKAGSVSDIATVVRALYHRSRIKELPILERKLYDNARSLLVDELSFSLGKDKGTIEEMINSRLQVGVKA
jgi:CarD family transcriptional regulator